MKKNVIFLVVITIVGILAACSNNKKTEIELTYMYSEGNTEDLTTLKVVDQFEKDNPNIAVIRNRVSHDDWLQNLAVLGASGDLPDTFHLHGGKTKLLSNGGLLADLTNELEGKWLDTFIPGSLDEFINNDRYYGVPANMLITHVIIYNQAILREAGYESLPKQWDEFIESLQAIKALGYIPIALGNKERWVGADPVIGTLFLRTAGIEWFEKILRREETFTNPDAIEALRRFKQLVDIGAFNEDMNSLDNKQQRALFYNGKAAMFVEGNWALSPVAEQAPPEVLENANVAFWPVIPGNGDPKAVTGGAGWGWGVSARLKGEKREYAIKLLKALTSEEYGKGFLEGGFFSFLKEVDYDKSKVPVITQKMGDLLQGAQVGKILTNFLPPSMLDAFGRAVQNISIGDMTPESAAQYLQSEYEKTEQ